MRLASDVKWLLLIGVLFAGSAHGSDDDLDDISRGEVNQQEVKDYDGKQNGRSVKQPLYNESDEGQYLNLPLRFL